jgi:hypothetical protein
MPLLEKTEDPASLYVEIKYLASGKELPAAEFNKMVYQEMPEKHARLITTQKLQTAAKALSGSSIGRLAQDNAFRMQENIPPGVKDITPEMTLHHLHTFAVMTKGFSPNKIDQCLDKYTNKKLLRQSLNTIAEKPDSQEAADASETVKQILSATITRLRLDEATEKVEGIPFKGDAMKYTMRNFNQAVLKEMPATLRTEFTVDGETYTEELTNMSVSSARDYLALQQKENNVQSNYQQQINYLDSLGDLSETRPSMDKEEPWAQGMATNLRQHRLIHEGKEESRVARGGACAFQDKDFRKETEELEKQLKVVNQKFSKVKQDATLANQKWDLQNKVDERRNFMRDCCVAQVLPKIASTLAADFAAKDISDQPLAFVEVGLLSSLLKNEKQMILDHKGALDYIQDNFTVRVMDDQKSQGKVTKKDGKFILHVYKEGAKTQDKELQCFYFSHAVDKTTQLFNKIRHPTRTDIAPEINQESGTRLQQLTGENPPENVKGFVGKLKQWGLSFGTSCKSAKDRTALKASQVLAWLSNTTNTKGMIDRLRRGLSLFITRINTGGRASKYAFYNVQRWGMSKEDTPDSDISQGGGQT